MAETLTPLAPPPNMASQAVQPVNLPGQPFVPAKPEPIVVQKTLTPTSEDRYNQAVAAKDPVALVNLAKDSPDTAPVAVEAAKTITKNVAQFNEMTKGINPSTPDGRVALANKFQVLNDPKEAKKYGYTTIADNPRWGDALMYFAAGDKATAMKQIMGGAVSTKIEYSTKTGEAIVKKVNELGEPVAIYDSKGNALPFDEYLSKYGGSVSQFSESLGGMKAKQQLESNIQENQKSIQRNSAWEQRLAADAPSYVAKRQAWEALFDSGLTKEERAEIASASGATLSYARSLQDGMNAFDQFSKGNATDLTAQNRQALGGAIASAGEQSNIPGLRLNADNTVTDSSGKKYNANELKNVMKNFNIGKQLDIAYQQTQANLAESKIVKKLTNDQFKLLQSALSIDQQIERDNAELTKNVGTPSFLRMPSAANITDQAARPIVQALQGEFNAAAIKEFQQWRKNEIARNEKIDPSYVPQPNELEAAFTRTDAYKNLQRQFRDESSRILSRPYKEGAPAGGGPGFGTVGEEQFKSMEKGVPAPASPVAEGRKDIDAANKAEKRQKALDKAAKNNPR
jgi:hypothetical protein